MLDITTSPKRILLYSHYQSTKVLFFSCGLAITMSNKGKAVVQPEHLALERLHEQTRKLAIHISFEEAWELTRTQAAR
jgi:hypothetical protein